MATFWQAYSLPHCHLALRQELDGHVEALSLLPEAEAAELRAREEYSTACRELSDARKQVAAELSRSVTNILPSLGLEGSIFEVHVRQRHGGYEEPYYGSAASLGVDIVDFFLLHQKSTDGVRGGNIEQVGSSGEKARVLLACETVVSGSIGSTCNSAGNISEQDDLRIPPVAIIYDEIDAHVGGRAAVTMAKLLADQSRSEPSSVDASASAHTSQIIAITHSATLAAIADHHIVVERGPVGSCSQLPVQIHAVNGSSRRKEIARMTSGDLAPGAAETFASALLKDAMDVKSSNALS